MVKRVQAAVVAAVTHLNVIAKIEKIIPYRLMSLNFTAS